MEKALQFGDESTADIELQLIGAEGTEHQADPLYVHYYVLRKSKYYETRLSDRLSTEKERPIKINIQTCHGDEIYSKCIQLMYGYHAGKPFCFSNVDEALAILPVASEIQFNECLEECIRYLNDVSWSIKQEVKLRALLLSLEINPLPDLAARLGGLPKLEQSLQRMLSTISSGSFDHDEYIEEYIVAHFETNSSFAETCRSALWKEFSANVERAKDEALKACAVLSWIVNVIERCDEAFFEAVLKMFCQNAEIPDAVYRSNFEYKYIFPFGSYNSGYVKGLVGLIHRFLRALGNGRVITTTSFRVSFLTNWIPILIQHWDKSDELEKRIISGVIQHWDKSDELEESIISGVAEVETLDPLDGYINWRKLYDSSGSANLVESIIDVAETLPPVDQGSIYNIWKEGFDKGLYSQYTTWKFEVWAKKVEDANQRHNIFFDMTGRNNWLLFLSGRFNTLL